MRLNSALHKLLLHLEQQYIIDPQEFVPLGYDFEHTTRCAAVKKGWIEARGNTGSRTYRITADGRRALGQNAEAFVAGERLADVPQRMIARITALPTLTVSDSNNLTANGSVSSHPPEIDHTGALEREIKRLRDHNIQLFSLLVSTHSLASTLMLKLLACQSPESAPMVTRFEELGRKIEEVTR